MRIGYRRASPVPELTARADDSPRNDLRFATSTDRVVRSGFPSVRLIPSRGTARGPAPFASCSIISSAFFCRSYCGLRVDGEDRARVGETELPEAASADSENAPLCLAAGARSPSTAVDHGPTGSRQNHVGRHVPAGAQASGDLVSGRDRPVPLQVALDGCESFRACPALREHRVRRACATGRASAMTAASSRAMAAKRRRVHEEILRG